jgi:hypothetical protein
MIAGGVVLVLAVVIFLIGLWGRRNATDLVPSSLSPIRQVQKARQFRRGALALILLSVAMVLDVAARVVYGLLQGAH